MSAPRNANMGRNDGNAVHKTIFVDIDGLCIVPKEAEREVFSKALEKAHGEKLVKKSLEAGISAVAINKEHGIM